MARGWRLWGFWVWPVVALSIGAQAQPLGGETVLKPVAGMVFRQEAGPNWAALSKSQQANLAPLKEEWGSVDASGKQKWLEVAGRMPRMNADERVRIQQRMTEWVRMSPTERGQARIHFQEARQLAPGGRQEQWDAYQALSPEQRHALTAQAASAAKKPAGVVLARKSATSISPTSASLNGKPTGTNTKRNIVSMTPASARPRQVGPTVVQSRQGATTSLMTTPTRPPAHQQVGLPKINATADFVDPLTLLPRRGPQGVAAAQAPKPAQAATLTQ